MSKALSWSSIVAFMLLCGCSNSKVASDSSISAAVKHYLKEDGALCLGLSKWPVVVEPDDLKMIQRFPSSIAGQMQVLEQAGLVSSINVALKNADIGGSNIAKSYQLTDQGLKFYRDVGQDVSGAIRPADVCFASRSFNQLIKWEPAQNGLGQEVTATYSYDVADIADWAKTPTFKVAFKNVAAQAFSPSHEQRSVVLMDSGWQVKTAL
ncbi:hypothetical protein [Aquirhabdus sp.]|uniref:hypothetical protein n=1 Tax=Aquirhabdus sp. TaxID=2824160 RepID=UPI00396CC4A8